MRTSNPTLTRAFDVRQPEVSYQELLLDDPAPPRGPIVTDTDTMTVEGVIRSTLVLLGLVVVGGVIGWNAVDVPAFGTPSLPAWTIVTLFVAFGLAILTSFKMDWAPFVAPVYAVLKGTFVGALSHIYEFQYDGIVLQAFGLTVATFFLMLVLFLNRTIRATPRFRAAIIAATGAIMIVYLATWILSFFDVEVPFIHDAGPIGILISVAITAVAALNLILDFDLVERGVAAGAPANRRWFAGFAITVTLVWLYLEFLRLLGKLRR